MRSFVALASLAFAAVASALPAMSVNQNSGVARRELVDVDTTVNNVANDAKVVSNSPINVASANAKQHTRGAPVNPATGYHTGLLDAVVEITGLARGDIIAQVLALVKLDLDGIPAAAVVNLLGIDLKILAVVHDLYPLLDLNVIIGRAGGNVEEFPHSYGYTKRDVAAPAAPAVPAAPLGALGALGGLGALTGEKAPRGDKVYGLGDILVAVRVDIQALCHDLTVAIDAAVSASAALDVALTILAKIHDVILKAQVDIKAIVNVEGALCLNGVAVTVQVVAQIIADIVAAIVVSIAVVLKACASVKTDVLVKLILDVTVSLAAVINVAALIAVDVVVEIKPLIQAVVAIICNLHLDVLIKLFALVA